MNQLDLTILWSKISLERICIRLSFLDININLWKEQTESLILEQACPEMLRSVKVAWAVEKLTFFNIALKVFVTLDCFFSL